MERESNMRKHLDCIIEIVHKPLKEKGEDAFAYDFEKESMQTQAVFDGCGGAGSWEYPEYEDSTGAFIAAQSMCKAYLKWFTNASPSLFLDESKTKESFHNMAYNTLLELKNECAPMKIFGSLAKSFPCTASIAIEIPSADHLSVTVLNVGDSRVYYLTPKGGLVQLTVDDSEGEPDPLLSLRENAPMSDMLNADKPFQIKQHKLDLAYPCAIITATDGVFGYVRSPMDFEFILLDTIRQSNNYGMFEESFKHSIAERTGDDSTCIISFYNKSVSVL